MAEEVESAVPRTGRPPLKWAGGKRWQVEPFAGGLAVTLGLHPMQRN